MQQTGYDASVESDPAVVRRIALDGLRRTGVAVHPFPKANEPIAQTCPADLILADLGQEHAFAELLGPLQRAHGGQATGEAPRGKE